ncbi:extracellular solute-binding protein [Pseudofrankia sp. DC12]|uniref:extracellular solute-binding protein n=1 Tax=Pseudofrankia sp. DC12 TaxID=683315 RepID=UPI000A7709CF|nr:extracellular solute-binding protein [Pseudofrankia sp. DC12]
MIRNDSSGGRGARPRPRGRVVGLRVTLPLLGAAVALAISAAACGGGGSSGVPDLRPTARAASAGVNGVNGATASPECASKVKTLSFYGVAQLSDVAKSAKLYMEKAHPGLTVQLNSTAGDYVQLVQQISADRAAGKQTDVAVAGFDLLPVFAKQLGAQELPASLLRSTYDQRFLKLGQVGGKQIGIPDQVSMPVLAYNADVLAKAGVDPKTLATTDGVLAAAAKIKAADPSIQPIDLPTGQQFGQWYLSTLASSKGTLIQNANGTPNLTAPDVVAAAQFLGKAGAFGPQSDDPTQGGLLRFGIQKQTAMVGATIASIGAGIKYIQSQGAKGFKFGVMPFPTLPGGKNLPIAGGNALTVLATDKCQKEMATELVVAMLAPDVVAASVEAVSYLPVDTAAATELAGFYQQYPELVQFKGLGDFLRPAPAWPGTRGGEVPQALTDQVIHVMKGTGPATAMRDAQATATQLTAS